tara:strand:+ start:17667 stop:17882 length:216 start_codon:yes stop_codon:yes gene_type:complete
MANNINWGKVYCAMITYGSFGVDLPYTTRDISDISAPACWNTFQITADRTTISGAAFKADTTNYKADVTQI